MALLQEFGASMPELERKAGAAMVPVFAFPLRTQNSTGSPGVASNNFTARESQLTQNWGGEYKIPLDDAG